MKQNYAIKGNMLVKFLVLINDFAILNVLLAAYIYFTPNLVPHYFHVCTKITFIVGNFAFIIAQYFYSSIIYWRQMRIKDSFIRTFKLVMAQLLLSFFFIKILSKEGGCLKILVIMGISLYIALIISRLLQRYIINFYRSIGRNCKRITFVGNDPALISVYNNLTFSSTLGYIINGYYADTEISECPKKFKHLGNISNLNEHLEKNVTRDCDDIYCSLSHNESDEIIKIMKYCNEQVVHFFYVPRMFGNYKLNLKPITVGDINMFSNLEEPINYPINKLIKRTFDILFSGFVCICILPFIPIIALIIKIQSPGPLFFSQERTGLEGKTFNCLKFRSMHVNKNADTIQATKDDPRKFAFGNFMRKTNIDELPQFFNVLRGDMSIVGPRPHMLHHTEMYSQLINKYMVRHFCKPGITGWAQVTGFRGETKELWEMEGRIRKDIWYIEHWSVLLDLRIILMTLKGFIIPDKNAY